MITGIPSGLSFARFDAFGMYTRLTARGCQVAMLACTRTATSARAWEVNATSPSIPAVLRPALRCVTCRTLISVFDRERSISFWRLLTLGQSPSRVALKIRCRSRRTSRSQPDQSTQSQSTASRSVSGGRSSGPFTISAPNLSFGSSCFGKPFVKGSPAHVGALSRPGAPRPVSGQLCEPTSGGLIDLVRFPVAFRPPALASWASCTRRGLGPSLPPAYRHPLPAWRTPTGFPCSARMRHDWGWAPSVPRGRWCPHGRAQSLAAICRLPTARPLSSRRSTPSRDVQLTRHQRGFTGIHPMPSLPLACGPRTERAPLGFPVSFAPDRRWQRRSRTSRRGQVSDTDPSYVFSIG